jgi:hypothetical protein
VPLACNAGSVIACAGAVQAGLTVVCLAVFAFHAAQFALLGSALAAHRHARRAGGNDAGPAAASCLLLTEEVVARHEAACG